MPRRLQSRSRSAHDALDSRNPSDTATSSLVASARTPIITSMHTLSCLRRILRWIPSTHTYTSSTSASDRAANARASSFHCWINRGSWPPTTVAGVQELLQRRGEVAGGQAMQIQQRQRLRHLRRLPCPGGQDRRRKPASRPGGLVDALVIDPRRPHRDRAGRGGHLPLGVVAVANHQPLPVHVDLAGMGLDVRGHLGSPSRTIASNSDELTAEPLTASRPAPSWTTLTMGVPSRTDAPNAGPDQNLDHFQIISGRCSPPRHLTEGPTSTGSDHCPTESSPRRRRQAATRRREQ